MMGEARRVLRTPSSPGVWGTTSPSNHHTISPAYRPMIAGEDTGHPLPHHRSTTTGNTGDIRSTGGTKEEINTCHPAPPPTSYRRVGPTQAVSVLSISCRILSCSVTLSPSAILLGSGRPGPGTDCWYSGEMRAIPATGR